MLNGRLYRASFLPFLVALGIAAFSVSARPAPLTSTLAPDAFEGAAALAELNSLAQRFPDRRPGSRSDQELATHVAHSLQALGASRCARITIGVSLVEPGRSAITVGSVRSPLVVCAEKRRSCTVNPPPAVPPSACSEWAT